MKGLWLNGAASNMDIAVTGSNPGSSDMLLNIDTENV
jgi:hypothetical protein